MRAIDTSFVVLSCPSGHPGRGRRRWREYGGSRNGPQKKTGRPVKIDLSAQTRQRSLTISKAAPGNVRRVRLFTGNRVLTAETTRQCPSRLRVDRTAWLDPRLFLGRHSAASVPVGSVRRTRGQVGLCRGQGRRPRDARSLAAGSVLRGSFAPVLLLVTSAAELVKDHAGAGLLYRGCPPMPRGLAMYSVTFLLVQLSQPRFRGHGAGHFARAEPGLCVVLHGPPVPVYFARAAICTRHF